MRYKIGDIVKYRTFMGDYRYVRVTDKEDNIKNGKPGFDGVVSGTQETVWGYDYQIVKVFKTNTQTVTEVASQGGK